MVGKVTDPAKITTDPVLLSALAKQGIDKDYVEFFEDYSPAHPEAKLYQDLKSDKQFAVLSVLPRVTKDGKRIAARWKLSPDGTYHADNNAFSASVDGRGVTVGVDGKTASWSPQVFLNGTETVCNPEPALLGVDPTNENYFNNILEWDYGFCKRRLRLIEGAILEIYILDHHPDYMEGMVVGGECNRCGKCDLGCTYQNPDGSCSVYYKRLEMGFLDCIKYPDVDDLLANTAPPECSYWIEYQGEKFQPRDVNLVIKSNIQGDECGFSKPYCTEGVLQVVGDEKRLFFNWRIDGRPRVWHYPLIIDDSATFFSSTSDGRIWHFNADWDTCHDAGTGTDAEDDIIIGVQTMAAQWNIRTLEYAIYRSFFYFDKSSISGLTVTAVTLSIYGVSTAHSDVCAMQGTQADPITTADFDSFTGSEFGHVSWVTDAYNDITFNAGGISYVGGTDLVKICAREYTHDYLDSDPGTDVYNNGCYYVEQGAGFEPKLVVTYTPAPGWTGKISGVVNPAKVMGVDVANIAKVKGVA